MSTTTPVISKGKPKTVSQDFATLRQRSIELLVQMSSKGWTDFNSHDPGITILEALCYAITELGLRINLPLDLLITTNSPDLLMRDFSPMRILPNHAVNRMDFRHISRGIDKLKNAWLVESSIPEIPVFWEELVLANVTTYILNTDAKGNLLRFKGLFDLYFELTDSSLNTNLILVNEGKVLVATTDPQSNPINEPYWIEIGLPYWDQFPKDWQETVVIDQITVNPVPVQHNPTANVFTAGVDIKYNGLAQPHSFGVVVRATALSTDYATVSELGSAVELILKGTFAGLTVQPFVQLNDKVKALAAQASALQARLALQRNLCQDFYKFRSIRIQEIAVEASIELPLPYSLEDICAELFFRLDKFFNPALEFFSLEKLRDEGNDLDDIYDGPLNDKGFARPGQQERDWTKATIYTSDLIHEMLTINDLDLAVKRIIAILDFSISSYVNNYPVVTKDRNCVKVIGGSFYRPIFSGIKSNIRFSQAGAELSYNKELALELFNKKKNAITTLAPGLPPPVETSLSTVTPNEYHSVQNDFPAIYGIGEKELAVAPNSLRQAQSNQLKGYLFHFDQLLANTSAQVDHLASYFSFNSQVSNTHFFQALHNVPGINEILISPPQIYETETAGLVETPEEFLFRRNRFLDHLLSIAAEDMSEYESVMLNYFAKQAATAADLANLKSKAQERLVKDKSIVLRELPELSKCRGLGFVFDDYVHLEFDTNLAQWKWKLVKDSTIHLESDSGFPNKRSAFDHLVQHWKELCSKFYYQLNIGLSVIEVHNKHVADGTSNVVAISPQTLISTLPEDVESAKEVILEVVQQIWCSTNVSGLEKRVGRFLGFRDIGRRNLVNINELQLFNIQKQGVSYAFVLANNELPYPLATPFGFASQAGAEADLDATILHGMDPNKYSSVSTATDLVITLDNTKAILPTITIPLIENPDEAEIKKLFVAFFVQHFGPQEGCFMIEHLLVRPRIKSVAAAPSLLTTLVLGEEVAEHDPYSNRFTLVLPTGPFVAFPTLNSRLSDNDFKRLTEKMFRQEAPAHLIGHFVWLSEADMATFQDLYIAWITLQFTADALEDSFADIQSGLVDLMNIHLNI